MRVTARCGSCRLPLQRLAAVPRRTSTVTRARPGSRGVHVSFRVSRCPPGSAFFGFGRSPLAVRDGLGVFLDGSFSRNRSPGRSSPGVRFPFRAGPRPGCPRSGLAAPACAGVTTDSSSGSPLLGFLLPRTQRRRVPRFTSPRSFARSRVGGGRQAPTGAVLRVAALSTVLAALAARTNPLRSPPFAVTPRRFAALFHAARVPGVALQSFPFSRSRTRSRGLPASLRVRVRPPNGAARSEGFAAPFPGASTSRHDEP